MMEQDRQQKLQTFRGTIANVQSKDTRSGLAMVVFEVNGYAFKAFGSQAAAVQQLSGQYAEITAKHNTFRGKDEYAVVTIAGEVGGRPVIASDTSKRLLTSSAPQQPQTASPSQPSENRGAEMHFSNTATVAEGQIGDMRVVSAEGKQTKLLLTVGGRQCKAYGEKADKILARYKNGDYTHAEGSLETCKFGEEFIIKSGHRLQPPKPQQKAEYPVEFVKAINGIVVELTDSRTIPQGAPISKAVQTPETTNPVVDTFKESSSGKESNGTDGIALTGTDSTPSTKSGLSPEGREALIQQWVRSYRDPVLYPDRDLKKRIQSRSPFAAEGARRVLEERASQISANDGRSGDFVQGVAA
jgi:hypothetical protein